MPRKKKNSAPTMPLTTEDTAPEKAATPEDQTPASPTTATLPPKQATATSKKSSVSGNSPEGKSSITDLSNFFEIQKMVESMEDTLPPQKMFGQIKEYIDKKAHEFLGSEYRVVFLYDMANIISDYTADRIYSSIQGCREKNLLLVIHSRGGMIEPAYIISKCCKELSKKFIVCVPRRAKSAATLLALGASEIHMGYMSELGPIDPQINGLPALALASAVKTISGVLTEHPQASEMFSKYLVSQLPLPILGYFERVAVSATQYAERLLAGHPKAQAIAQKLVHEYKDHGFVIDRSEAIEILGDRIKTETQEYEFGKHIHQVIEMINLVLEVRKQLHFSFVGTETYGMALQKKVPDGEIKK